MPMHIIYAQRNPAKLEKTSLGKSSIWNLVALSLNWKVWTQQTGVLASGGSVQLITSKLPPPYVSIVSSLFSFALPSKTRVWLRHEAWGDNFQRVKLNKIPQTEMIRFEKVSNDFLQELTNDKSKFRLVTV